MEMVVAVHPSIRLLRDKRHLLTETLEELGYAVTEMADGQAPACSLLWLVGNCHWYPRLRRSLLTLPKAQRPFTVLWHYEPLPVSRASGLPRYWITWQEIKRVLLRQQSVFAHPMVCTRTLLKFWHRGGLDLIATTNCLRQEYLEEQGVPSLVAPLGSHPTLGRRLDLERNIDVLLLDGLSLPRRKKAAQSLLQAGILLDIRGGWTDSRYWGEGRTELINRCKIFLNLHNAPGDLNGLRLQMGMVNGALVISEPMYRPHPYVPGRHYVESTLQEMPARIRHYLESPQEARAIAEAGYALVTQEVTFRASVERILTHCPH